MTRSAAIADEGDVAPHQIERLLALRVIECGPRPPTIKLPGTPVSEVMARHTHSWSITAAVAQGLATHRVRHMPLHRLFAVETARCARNRVTEEDDLARLRGAFDRIAGLFGEADACFPRSLAFRHLAMRRGHHPSLVFGVKIDPFAAHCWVQTGARVDNDSIECVRLFTPIHVL
jgi:hypothetical protein